MHRKEFPTAIHWAMILGLLILVTTSDIGNEAHSKSQTFINVTMKYITVVYLALPIYIYTILLFLHVCYARRLLCIYKVKYL
jgi:hypothetical protein